MIAKKTQLTVLASLFALALAAGPVWAADENTENSREATTERSTNPVTGTETDTRTARRKVQNADGSKYESKVKDKKKTTTDGNVEHKIQSTESIEKR